MKVRKGREASLFYPTGVDDDEGKPIFVSMAEIPGFFTADFWEAYEFYAACELFGELGAPPFSGGWATWPEIAVKSLLTFKIEASRCDAEELKKAQGGER